MIDLQTRFEIEHLISRYVWALDTGDLEQVARLVTQEALLRDTAGNPHAGREAVRGYFAGLMALPEFRGRQHHIDNCLFTPEGEGLRCRAYWTVTQWLTGQGRKEVVAVGHSSDLFVQQQGEWRFAERLLYHWRDADCPWVPDGTA
jgi:ketosteroid isomerase-like protein